MDNADTCINRVKNGMPIQKKTPFCEIMGALIVTPCDFQGLHFIECMTLSKGGIVVPQLGMIGQIQKCGIR
jgi:hypothetical protein